MRKWNDSKDIRKLCQEDKEYLIFSYYNKSYSKQTVSLVNMLFDEIQKDFPRVSQDNVHIRMLPVFPYEIVLQFALLRDEIQNVDFSKFKKTPEDFLKSEWPKGVTQ